MRESWTDDRMDDLNGRVADGFRQVDRRFDRLEGDLRALRTEMRTESTTVRGEVKGEFTAVRGEMKEEFAAVRGDMKDELRAMRSEMTERFDRTQAMMIRIGAAMVATQGAALMGLIATLA